MLICRCCFVVGGGHPRFCEKGQAPDTNHDWVNAETEEGQRLMLERLGVGRVMGSSGVTVTVPEVQWAIWNHHCEQVVDGFTDGQKARDKAQELANDSGERMFLVGDGRRLRIVAPRRWKEPAAGWEKGFAALLAGECPWCGDTVSCIDTDGRGLSWACSGTCNP